jgi:glucokinase
MLLAGDIGGTKTLLGLFVPDDRRPVLKTVSAFVTLDHPSLVHMVGGFLETAGPLTVEAACFGVAGPVREQRAELTNIPWAVAASEIASAFSFPSVSLLNDLEAMAFGVSALDPHELAVLQRGQPVAGGNGALIAAGTGLGEAMLHRVDGRLVPAASEGGHADYSPRTGAEVGLMQMLTSLHGRAEWEQVLSGRGLVNLHRFTHPGGCDASGLPLDPVRGPRIISRAALEGRCSRCVEALEMFATAYGAEAGNLALRYVATAGVFLGGGIAPKILPALQKPAFLDAFRSKPPMTAFLETIPVSVVLNEETALLGAAVFANGARRR